jgi:hypothetical protein
MKRIRYRFFLEFLLKGLRLGSRKLNSFLGMEQGREHLSTKKRKESLIVLTLVGVLKRVEMTKKILLYID